MIKNITFFSAFLLSVAVFGAQECVLFVAPPPLGSDANTGTQAAPLASLDGARRVVRSCLQAGVKDVIVLFQGGRYEMSGPVIFTGDDSVRGEGHVTYQAVEGEKPVFSGGKRITGWARGEDGVWFAHVGTDVDFRQLWVNGVRAVRARQPNLGKYYTLSEERVADGFVLPKDILKGQSLALDQVEISVLIAWMHKRLRISRVYEMDGNTHAVINPLEWDAVCNQPQGDRVYKGRHFWLENAREFLDEPGEFFLDRAKGVLFYLPRAGEDLKSAEVVRPVAESLVHLEGSLDNPAYGLVFSGLTFCETGWTRPNRSGFVDVQANSLVPEDIAAARDEQYRHKQRKDRVPGAFHALAAENVRIENCRFERLGGTGVLFVTGRDVVIAGNVISQAAGGGVEIGNDAFAPKDARLVPTFFEIHGNRISQVGQDYFGSVGILGYYTGDCLISQNDVFNCPYTTISWGWGWGHQSDPSGVGRNRIIGNHVYDFMHEIDDGGGLYTVGCQPVSEIAGNVVECMNVRDTSVAVGGAIYPDQASQGFFIHDNVVRGVVKWLHLWTDSIRNNVIRDNFADTTACRNDGVDNVVEMPVLIDGRAGQEDEWPERAREIAEKAGAGSRVREAPASRD